MYQKTQPNRIIALTSTRYMVYGMKNIVLITGRFAFVSMGNKKRTVEKGSKEVHGYHSQQSRLTNLGSKCSFERRADLRTIFHKEREARTGSSTLGITLVGSSVFAMRNLPSAVIVQDEMNIT